AQLRPTDDDGRAKPLVADESKERTIHDRTGLASAAAVDAMTRGTINRIDLRTALRVGRLRVSIRGGLNPAQSVWFGPTNANSCDNGIYLLIRQHPAGLTCKRWHGGPGGPVGDHLTYSSIVGNREVNRIGETHGGAALAFGAMASGAIGAVERFEVHHLVWSGDLRSGCGSSRRIAANRARGCRHGKGPN